MTRAFLALSKLAEHFGVQTDPYTYYKVFNFGDFSIAPASQFIIAAAYLSTFFLLAIQFHGITGFFVLIGFGLVPMAGQVGLTEDDALKLFFWSVFLAIFSRALSNKSRQFTRSPSLNFCHGLLWGAVGTVLMENIGIAVSITLFLIALIVHLSTASSSSKGLWIIYAGSTVGTLMTLGIILALAYRHPDVSWVHTNEGIRGVWTIYSQFDKLSNLLIFCYRILLWPTIVAIAVSAIAFGFKQNLAPFERHFYAIRLVSFCAFTGFFCTAFAGLWLGAGFRGEWPRQLLPLALVYSWLIPSVALLLISRVRSLEGKQP
jgi:hypothetical protein